MDILSLVSDTYERKARLYPALLLVAPVAVASIAIFSSRISAVQSFTGALLVLGGAFLFAQLARDAGKKGEMILFAKWDGQPSVAIFRHRDARINAVTKLRYHKKLASLVKEAKAPSIESESKYPADADSVYSAWSHYLRVHTRDTKKFSLLFHENISYGYRRNIWGLRPVGTALASLSLVACIVRAVSLFQSVGVVDEALLGASLFALILLALWVFRFTADWVKIPADAYAARLAESTEVLAGRTNIKKGADDK